MRRSLMRHLLLTPAASLAALTLAVPAALAQQAAPAVPAKLSLKDSISLAVNYNSRHRDSYVNVQDARSRLRSAGELRKSTWDSNITQTAVNNRSDTLDSNVGSTYSIAQRGGTNLEFNGQLPWVGNGSRGGELGVQVAMPLARGKGKTSSTRTSLDRAELSLRNQELSHFINQQDLVTQVVAAYYNALRARELIEVQKRSVAFNQQVVSDTEKRLAAGLITEIDLTRAQQQLSSAQVLLVNRTQSSQNSLDNLVLLLGLPVGSFPDLTDTVPYTPIEVDVDASIREALAHRPELEQYHIQRAQAHIDFAVAKDQRKPKADLVANLTNVGFGFLGGGGIGRVLTSILGLRLSVPVSKRSIEETEAQSERNLSIIDYLERNQKEQITQEVRNLARSAETARKNLELLTSNLKIAQRAVQIAQRFIEEGLKDNRDLLDAQQTVTNTESSILDAQVNYFLTMVNLREALGQDLLKQFEVAPLQLPDRPLMYAAADTGRNGNTGASTVGVSNSQFGREAYPATLR